MSDLHPNPPFPTPPPHGRRKSEQRAERSARDSGRELVVVANRLPVRQVRKGGQTTWQKSPGGLVTALSPILSRSKDTWIGWSGRPGESLDPFLHEGIRNVPVPISKKEHAGYYEGFSNRTLWPLYHDAIRTPQFQRDWWTPYVEVNRRFAEVAARHAGEGALVWVQDYHLQLVPRMLRDLRPDLRIGFFLHIPFPPQELFAQLPWREEILEGLLGADLFGAQTKVGAQNFAQLARRFAGARGTTRELTVGERTVRCGAFPISIDVDQFAGLAASDKVRRGTEKIRRMLEPSRKVLLGVDRLDYTKGIDIRLNAYHELLQRGSISADECVLVQLAVPSRENVREYAQQRRRVEELVGKINGEFGGLGRVAVHYVRRNVSPEELVSLYCAADVMLVTPLRDGMNLVCKEYVATRLDDTGVLVLSEFTGAATEFRSALMVNPHNLDGLADAIEQALQLSPSEATRRMKALRKSLAANDVHRWARAFLEALRECSPCVGV